MTTSTQRYHSLSIVLHWAIGLALLFMFASGLYMVNADISKADQYRLFQIHKASGVLVLWAVILRVGTRLVTRSPALPDALSQQQLYKAKLGHIFLYIALVTMPLSGQVFASYLLQITRFRWSRKLIEKRMPKVIQNGSKI